MEKMINNNNVKISNVSKKYKKKLVIKNLNLELTNKSRIGIVGPNGSGKTTLCEMIAQLRKPTSGTIILKENLKIGMQLQESKYPRGMTAWDLVNYYLRTYKLKKSIKEIQKLLYFLDVEDIINKPIANLSGGQQQKINILLALIVEPDLLILDELATGLDLEVRERIYELLEKEILTNKELSILIVSHNMNEIERFCNELIFMLNGEIISIHNIKNIVNEYGNVESFVKKQFKEYKIGIYNKTAIEKKMQETSNEKWVKSWKRHLKKKNKKDKSNEK